MISRLAAGLGALAALGAGEPVITVLDPPARSGIPLRVQVTPATPAAVAARLVTADGQVVAEALTAPAQRSTLVLVPERTGDADLLLEVSCDGLVVSRPVATAGAVLRAADTAAGATPDALQPALWKLCIAELASQAPSAATTTAIATYTAWLRAWPASPPASPLAWRDPIDGGIVPYRLQMPDGPGPHPLAIIVRDGSGSRHDWPALPATWLLAAHHAQVAVLEVWPAGDRRWRGVAPRRLRQILATLDTAVDRSRGAVVSDLDPADAPYPVSRPSMADDPAWWRSILGDPRPETPIAGWGQRPFRVLVGTGEHTFAATGNRTLAEAFARAWQQHAGVAPQVTDDRQDPPPGLDLVLVGNPRNHRVLADLVAQGLRLEATWDHRVLRAGERSWLRAARVPVVLPAQLPDGRQVLVLDGGVPDWGPDLPLAGRSGILVDLDVGGRQP